MSLDVLKLYRGEDIDPDRYADDRELTELPEIPLVELERVHMEPATKVEKWWILKVFMRGFNLRG